MTEYRYIFGSLRDEQIVAEIPLYGTFMDLELNVGGQFNGSFNLDQSGISNRVLLDATSPGRTWVVCERNGDPVWAGFIWSRTYQSQSKSIQLFANSFEKYPAKQLMRTQFTRIADQLQIFKDLWADMQLGLGRNININLPTATPPVVVLKSVDIAPTDYKYYSEVMDALATGTTGFDWTIDIAKSGQYYIKTLRYGYPVTGSPEPKNLTFEYPGDILNYYATESMAEAGTNVFTLGNGEGTSMPNREVTHQDLLDGGFPRWDSVAPHKDVDSQSAIDAIAIQEAAVRRPPMLVMKPTLKANLIPEFGSFGLGDACNVYIKDPRFPEGFTFTSRVIKWTLNPEASDQPDEFTIIFAGDENG